MSSKNIKAGIFVLIAIVLLVWMILKVNQGGSFFSNTYSIYLEVDTAVGLSRNTPVQIAGVDVGLVKDITLSGYSKALLRCEIFNGVKISKNAIGRIKTSGLLGDAYVEIFQTEVAEVLKDGDKISDVKIYGDMSSLTSEMGSIASDVKAITTQLKKLVAGDDSPFDKTIKNIEKITTTVAKLSTKNEKNINSIIANLQAVSKNLNLAVKNNTPYIDRTMYNISDITSTIQSGRGTMGRLIKDEDTIDKMNDALDNFNNFLGGASRTRIELGGHTEYLGGTQSFKNYVSLAIQPRPDKYFLFEVTSDPDPSSSRVEETTTITSGGNTTTIDTYTRTKNLNQFRFSLQFAKRFQDLTLRGGLIESTGGFGVDYVKGPLDLQFSAFDFQTEDGQKPHLKFLGKAKITDTFYVLGGLDDFINPNQDLDWFFGAGFQFTDDDVKSLLGLLSAGARSR